MSITRLSNHQGRITLLTPCYASLVPAGFPSPADDYMDKALDLNEHLIKNPAATFYCRVSGQSLTGIGIFDGDLLIVDRSLKPQQGSVILAVVDGELTCKILDLHRQRLLSANRNYPPITIREGSVCEVEGVVINSIRFHRPGL